jgi:signal transduction histidine kinase
VSGRSLRLRLLAGAAVWIGLALLVAGVAIATIFVAIVEQEQQADLNAVYTRLVALIDPEASPPSLTAALADPRYDTPFSGLYWQIEQHEGEVGRSRSLWDFVLPSASFPNSPVPRFARLQGPAGQSLSALLRDIRLESSSGQRAFRVTVAEDRAVLDAAIARFGWGLAVALAVLAAVLIGAAWLQVRVGLSPLDRLRRGIEAIRRGEAETLSGDFPAEVLPLTAEVNELLAAQRTSIEFARSRAADLAHGLKTPLAVLATTVDELRTEGKAATAERIEQLAGEMADRVDYQLRLSRLRMRPRAHELAADLEEALGRTIAVLERTREGERLAWRLNGGGPLTLDIDRHDLVELVGVVLENAARWATSEVVVTTRREGADGVLEVADDGPGLTDDEIARLGERGRPLDTSGHGSGLGIAIAQEIAALNNGALTFNRSGSGGLAVRLRIPISARRTRGP